MVRAAVFSLVVVAFVQLPFTARGVTIRYALVMGNNIGVDRDGEQPFKPLKHAEREAELLRRELIGLSNFDASSKRTRLLTGGTHHQVEAAVEALAAQKAADEKMLGQVDSLFLFYFTGHGLEGRLLLRDGPLTAADIGRLVSTMKASFSVGVFDACYAGSLESAVLSEKGIDPTPGLNMFRELPEEVLSAEGSVWYVSSGPGQQSYEDEQLGGVFTHFFIEALRKAHPEGPGIPLDSIWQYARQHTVEYTALRKRTQLPERYIAKMRSGAPVYFSFPISRSATLVLSAALAGRFALSYADGHLTEVFDKKAGTEGIVAVFPGKGRLMRIENGTIASIQSFNLPSGGKIVLSNLSEPPPAPNIGQRVRVLQEKGASLETRLRVTTLAPGTSVLAGIGYSFDVITKQMLSARHGVTVPIRLDVNNIVLGATIIYGIDHWTFSSWGYLVKKVGAELSGGYGWDVGFVRIDVSLAYRFGHLWQTYDSGRERTGWQHGPTAAVRMVVPRNRRLAGTLFAAIGPLYGEGAGAASDAMWDLSGTLGVCLVYRLF